MSSICKGPSLNLENVQADLHERLFARMNLKIVFNSQVAPKSSPSQGGHAGYLLGYPTDLDGRFFAFQQSGRSQELALAKRARMLFTRSVHLPSTTSSLGTRAGSWFMHSPTVVEETKLAFGPGDAS